MATYYIGANVHNNNTELAIEQRGRIVARYSVQTTTPETQALDGRHQKLGKDHLPCFESMHELAVLYKEQSRYDKAEPLLIEAIGGRRLKLGDTHPHTIESMNNLIDLYEAWNKAEEAEKWRAKLTQTDDVEE